MIKQQMSLVLEDTAINLPEKSEDFECSERELSNFNAQLAVQDREDVKVVSVERVRISSEMDSDQEEKWIATLSVTLIVEAEPSFFSKLRWFGDVPELHHFKETILDSIAGSDAHDFSGSWYMKEMNPAPELSVELGGYSM